MINTIIEAIRIGVSLPLLVSLVASYMVLYMLMWAAFNAWDQVMRVLN